MNLLMQNIKYLICLAILTSSDLFAQGGFKKDYMLENSLNNASYDVVEAPNGNFIITGITIDSVNNLAFNKLTLAGTDHKGNLLWRKDYGNIHFQYLNLLQGGNGTVADTTAFYQTLGVRDHITNRGNAILVKFNYSGDTIWQKMYVADSTERFYPYGLCKSVDGGFLITGICIGSENKPNQTALLIKTNYKGEELWRKKITKDPPNIQGALSVMQDSSSKRILISGYQQIGNLTGSITYGSILFLDSLGNKIMQKSYNNAGGGAFGNVIQLGDGNFLSGGQWCVDYEYAIYKCMLVKFDIAGNQIWRKIYEPAGYINGISQFHKMPDKDIVCLGLLDKFTYSDTHQVQLIRFDPNGNLKSKVYFGKKRTFDNIASYPNLTHTQDGGFVIAARYSMDPPPTPFSLIKLDSLGCDTLEAYCRNPVGLPEEMMKNSFNFEIYPNPASGFVNIRGNVEEGEEFVISVTDVSGRKLLEIAFAGGSARPLDVSGLAGGVYFFTFRYEGRAVAVKKVVVGS
jgi:hypothetical protein